MVAVNNLSMVYGARLLFDDATFNLIKGRRYGVVGANGCGKSTFMQLLTSHETPSSGEVSIPKHSKIGWLKQDQYRYENDKIIDVVLQGRPALWNAIKEKDELLNRETLDDKAGYRLGELEEIIALNEGYEAEAFAQILLVGLGLRLDYHEKKMHTLSGGFKLRVLLAQTLFDKPDILLLDEPTNYLDIMSISWLEKYILDSFKGTLVFISHDQDFLNNLATDILDIDYGEIRKYTGNYNQFINEKKTIMEQKLHEKAYLDKKIAHMRVFVEKFRASASRAKQSQSREKMIDKIEMPNIEKSSRVTPPFSFHTKRASGQKVLEVTGIGKQYPEKRVLHNVHFTVQRHEKLAIIGRNGVGKSTLLKILMGLLKEDAGNFKWGHETNISYFAQEHRDTLNESMTLFDWMCSHSSVDSIEQIYRALGGMLFTNEECGKNVLSLSGGEAARLLFARIMLQKGNVLVLDEPTNHLDVEARGALAGALKKYDGTVVFVSHDRHFVSEIANRILTIHQDKVEYFQGSYNEYLKAKGVDFLLRA